MIKRLEGVATAAIVRATVSSRRPASRHPCGARRHPGLDREL